MDACNKILLTHKITYRVIYGDTDNMGIVYYANYLRWFEMGRTEMLRFAGFSYKEMEANGFFLPVSEVFCKFISSVKYDDVIVIETLLDKSVKAGMKFDYNIFNQDGNKVIAKGYTKHAWVNCDGRVMRPPLSLTNEL